MKNEVLAICLKTYPDEDDMRKYCDGELEKPGDVRIYHKGKKYWVTKLFDEEYYKLIET